MGKTGRIILGAVLIGAAFIATPLGPIVQAGLLYAGAALIRSTQIPKLQAEQAQALRNEASTENGVLVIYGTCVVGIKAVDIRVSGQENQFLYLVGAICHGSRDGGDIMGIDDVWFDERLAFDAAGVLQSAFLDQAWLYKHAGSTSQVVDAHMASTFPAAYPSTSKGAGIAYLIARLFWRRGGEGTAYPTGVPTVWVKIRGARVYDPRDSTWKFSDNPALCVRDYLLSTVYGASLDPAEIDETSFINAANYCDETVQVPDPDGSGTVSQKRFTTNGWLDTTEEVLNNLQRILSSCRGELSYQAGQYSLFIRKSMTPSGFVFSRANIVGNFTFKTTGIEDAPNIMKAQYTDPGQRHQVITVQWPQTGDSNAFLTEDNNFRVEGHIELPMTNDPYMARQIAMSVMKERRWSELVTFTATEEALKCRVGDLVEITHDTPGWTGRDAWVSALVLRADSLVDVVCQTYDGNAYTYDLQSQETSVPDTDLPDPFTQPPAPTFFTLTTGTLAQRIKAEWYQVVAPYVVAYEVEARRDDDPTFRTYPGAVQSGEWLSSFIDGVADGELWHVRVRAVNSIGVKGAWATASHTVSIANVVEYTVAVTPEDDAVFYAINWGTDCAVVRVYSVEYATSGGAVPPETNEYLAAEIIKASGAQSVRIATTPGAFRVTKTVGYAANGTRGPVYIFDDQANGGTGPTNPPTTLAQDTGGSWQLRQTTLLFTWANGDGTAQTGVWVNGVQMNLFAAGTTSGSVDGLVADTCYDVEIAHYKNGVWNPDLADKVGPVSMCTEPATLDAPVGFDAFGAYCSPGSPYMGFEWALGANAAGAKTKIQRSATGAFAGEQIDLLTTEAGATAASDNSIAPQFARPDSTIASFNSGDHTSIDEVSPSDADYVQLDVAPAGGGGPTTDTGTVGLSNVTDPAVSGGHVLRVRHCIQSPMVTGGSIKAELLQSGVLKATMNLNRFQASFSTESYTLTGTEADSITSYPDLQVRLTIEIGPSDSAKWWRTSWIELQVPGGSYYFRARHEKQYVTSSAWTSPGNTGVYGDCE